MSRAGFVDALPAAFVNTARYSVPMLSSDARKVEGGGPLPRQRDPRAAEPAHLPPHRRRRVAARRGGEGHRATDRRADGDRLTVTTGVARATVRTADADVADPAALVNTAR